MRVLIVANDTRGGVEPYAHLARGLNDAGHEVTAAAPADDLELFPAAVAFAPLDGVSRTDIARAAGPQPPGSRTAHPGMAAMGRLITERTRRWARTTRDAAGRPDLVCAGVGGLLIAHAVAESVGVPLVRTHLQPLDAPSSRYPAPLAPALARFGGFGNVLGHRATAVVIRTAFRAPARAARDALGLPRRSARTAHPTILYGFSPAVVPVTSDARTTRIATGYWAGPAPTETVEDRLRAFVGRPGPVVSVGFGSMTTGDPAALRTAVLHAVRAVGVRAVLLSGWGALSSEADPDSDDDVLTVASAPHTWLFPRMTATVHHGGAGTTGAALTAGIPTVIVPFGADQPFWGLVAQRLGVAPAPIPRRQLDAGRLAAALRTAVRSPSLRAHAAALGDRLRAEDGVGTAVRALEAVGRR